MGATANTNPASKPRFTLTQVRKMTVSELRNELRTLGLDTEGLKGALQDRLHSALYPVISSNPSPENIFQNLDFQKAGPVLK